MQVYDKSFIEANCERFMKQLIETENEIIKETGDEEFEMYGRDEYGDVHSVEVDDDEIRLCYMDRKLVYKRNDSEFEFFIRSHNNTEWVGDDVDYYGEILSYFIGVIGEKV